MSTLIVENVGPIKALSIPCPEGGGVVVLRGPQGAGKSLTIAATQRLLGGNGKVPVRDLCKSGSIEGFGARVRFGGRVTQSGELEAESIEGRFDLASLVDPKIADVEAADAKRIRALLSLAGAESDVKRFADVADADTLASIDVGDDDDLVSLAGKVKRHLEAEARKVEKMAETYAAEAKAKGEAAGACADEPIDTDALHQQLGEANAKLEDLKDRQEMAVRSAEKVANANAELAKLGEADVDGAAEDVNDATLEVNRIERELANLNAEFADAKSRLYRLQSTLEAERLKARAIETCRNVLDEGELKPPTAKEIELAEQATVELREAISTAAVSNANLSRRKEADVLRQKARERAKQAERLRESAASTDRVLSDAVADLGVPLFVQAGRLVTETDRGVEPYAELSHGERWKMAIDLAVQRVGEGGVVPIVQEAFEGLTPSNKRLVAEHAKARNVVILTAEARDGELVAEEF